MTLVLKMPKYVVKAISVTKKVDFYQSHLIGAAESTIFDYTFVCIFNLVSTAYCSHFPKLTKN